MIKGIYNENEFYTNHYWSSKFFGELESKTQNIPHLKTRANTIKELGDQYWDLLEGKDASKVEHTEQFVQFYQNLLKGLGYSFDPKKRQTVEGLYYSVATEVKQDSKSHLLIALTESNESGSFESLPLELVKLNKQDDDEAEDRDLAEITSEELDSETGPKWFVVGALDNIHLIQRGKWSYGRFIRVNLSEIFAQKDDKAYTTLLGLFSKEILAPESGLSIHEELDDNSHRHAFEVTTKLREGVRESIELLINEMIYAKKEAHKEYLKKDKDADEYAKELTHDALFYVYRLIFLLFLESQGEDSELLPLKSEIYRHGYSLEKLLEIAFKQIHEGTQEYEGTFIQESLERIFDLIFNGFVPQRSGDFLTENLSSTGFLVKGLKSDLFDPGKVKHLKGVSLRNGVLQKMLQKLSMADIKEGKKTRKARVSYANLGINQLGAVYEGLLSYTGFFAKEDLYELTQVKKGKDDDASENDEESSTKATKVDPDKIYLAPKSLVEKYKKDKKYKLTDKHFVLDKETGEPVCYKKGSFIFRMAGRDRQKLASFYTPESLTKCTVKYALKVLFESKKTAEELRKVKILEPAMGSGAFLNEAVNQLADKIIELELKENPSRIKTPKDRQKRLLDIKYDLISENVYGVDLNPTAVELARFSLWLNCIGSGKEPPQFEGKLKVGNSLIGARFRKNADGIFPWITLNPNMMSFWKKLGEYDSNAASTIKEYRETLLKSELSHSDPLITKVQLKAEELYTNLSRPSHKTESYYKLKACCDLWCSLFFTNGDELSAYPKTHKEYLIEIYNLLISTKQITGSSLPQLSDPPQSERFFHWELEFPEELQNGGFDLIVGNPPWISIQFSPENELSDINPIIPVFEPNQKDLVDIIRNSSNSESSILSQEARSHFGRQAIYSLDPYEKINRVPPNTFKYFTFLSFFLLKQDGAIGLIKQDSLLDDRFAEEARIELYHRYRYHFSFINQKKLFEIGNTRKYSINVYGSIGDSVKFDHIGTLFSPMTVDLCYLDPGTTDLPPVKDSNGDWNFDGAKNRIISVTDETLKLFAKFNNEGDFKSTQFIDFYSTSYINVVQNLMTSSVSILDFLGDTPFAYSDMIKESQAVKSAEIRETNTRSKTLSGLVLSAAQIDFFNPFSQETKSKYTSHRSYQNFEIENIWKGLLPRTRYSPIEKNFERSVSLLPKIGTTAYVDTKRIALGRQIDIGTERSLYVCIIPPEVSHLHSISSISILDDYKLFCIAGVLSSLVMDAWIRIKNYSDVYPNTILDLPISQNRQFLNKIALRAKYLFNVITGTRQPALGSEHSPLLNANLGNLIVQNNANFELIKRHLLFEIDVLTALSFDLKVDELIDLVNLFPVLTIRDKQKNEDRKEIYKNLYSYFTGDNP